MSKEEKQKIYICYNPDKEDVTRLKTILKPEQFSDERTNLDDHKNYISFLADQPISKYNRVIYRNGNPVKPINNQCYFERKYFARILFTIATEELKTQIKKQEGLKRFLVFAGHKYYPSRGMGDFRGDADTLDQAKDVLKIHIEHEVNEGYSSYNSYNHYLETGNSYNWADIYDTHTRENVWTLYRHTQALKEKSN